MKRIFLSAVMAIFATFCATAATVAESDRVVVAYVTSWSSVIPDPFTMTHINYAFGHVNDTFDGVRIDNPERLKEMVALKKTNPDLKVMLSVGGWGSGRFSEMAMTKSTRRSFAQDCLRVVKEFGLDGIVVIGGDGSFRGARDLSLAGIPCVGVPATIDNDIGCSDYTIGVDTALNTIIESVDKIRDTSHSHNRCSLVEVMGRHCGYLALHAGIATGAMAIFVPEHELDFQKDIVERMQFTRGIGKKHFIMLVAEGVNYPGGIAKMAEDIEDATGVVTKTTVLGYVQRGGSPTAKDRIIATKLGVAAVHLLAQGIGNRVVAVNGEKIVDYDINEALNMKKDFDNELYDISHEISI